MGHAGGLASTPVGIPPRGPASALVETLPVSRMQGPPGSRERASGDPAGVPRPCKQGTRKGAPPGSRELASKDRRGPAGVLPQAGNRPRSCKRANGDPAGSGDRASKAPPGTRKNASEREHASGDPAKALQARQWRPRRGLANTQAGTPPRFREHASGDPAGVPQARQWRPCRGLTNTQGGTPPVSRKRASGDPAGVPRQRKQGDLAKTQMGNPPQSAREDPAGVSRTRKRGPRRGPTIAPVEIPPGSRDRASKAPQVLRERAGGDPDGDRRASQGGLPRGPASAPAGLCPGLPTMQAPTCWGLASTRGCILARAATFPGTRDDK